MFSHFRKWKTIRYYELKFSVQQVNMCNFTEYVTCIKLISFQILGKFSCNSVILIRRSYDGAGVNASDFHFNDPDWFDPRFGKGNFLSAF